MSEELPDPNKTKEEWLKEVQEAVAQLKDLKSMTTDELINFADNSVNDYWGVNDLVLLNIFLVRHLKKSRSPDPAVMRLVKAVRKHKAFFGEQKTLKIRTLQEMWDAERALPPEYKETI